uniref:CS domain-containing protein n=1 Tax=Percolomonas cosmopolitus TaxID=63605 RepID=A0A7S1KUM0_9EUKA|mmetsp:Transcript_9771/g.36428  ORF Transcript_9771/g.36428 Transcript_9771/m.36428 type:complete len:563 (+) Transcript_9771:77-1765(+)
MQLSHLLPFTYSQSSSLIKILFQLPEGLQLKDEDDLEVNIQENHVIVQLADESEELVLNLDLSGSASTIASTYKLKNGNLQLKLVKQIESSRWGSVFANGFSYVVAKQFPSVEEFEEYNLEELHDVAFHDISLNEQLPPFTHELELLKDRIVALLVTYENMKREWLRENQSALKEAKERGLEVLPSEADDLEEYAEELWEDVQILIRKSNKDSGIMKQAFEKAKEAADYGNVPAQKFVAEIYTTGQKDTDIEKDDALVQAYLKRSLFQTGNLKEVLPLVATEERLYESDKSRSSTLQALYLKAAQLGHTDAFYKLGLLLRTENVDNDRDLLNESITWWKLAVARGHAEAARAVASAFYEMEKPELARAYYTIAHEWNDQIVIPSDLVQPEASVANGDDDTEHLLDEVLQDIISKKDSNGTTTEDAEVPKANPPSQALPAQAPPPSMRSETPIVGRTDQFAGKLRPRSIEQTLQSLAPPSSSRGALSKSPMKIEEHFDEEDEEEEDVQMEPGFLWKAVSYVSPLALAVGVGYAVRHMLVVPANVKTAQPGMGVGGGLHQLGGL